MERRYKETDSSWIREEFESFQNKRPCETCEGYRLNLQARSVKINDLHIGEIVEMSIKDALHWFSKVQSSLSLQKQEIACLLYTSDAADD